MQSCQYMLLHTNMDKNPRDIEGWTPLHHAAKSGHLSTYKLIASHVNNKRPLTIDGKTPQDLAPKKRSHLYA